MIADLDETLKQLLIDEMPIRNDEVQISFEQPKREWSSRLNRPAINLFLYDLRENVSLRQHQWERMAAENNKQNLTRLKRSPYRLDCFYAISAWAAEPEDEHRLLSRCLMALFRYPILPQDHLLGEMQHQPFEIQAHLASPEQLTNTTDLWGAMDNEMRPVVPYVVTLALDPWTEMTEPLVRTVRFRSGMAEGLPIRGRLGEAAGITESVGISGFVLKKSQKNAPQPGIAVAIKGTGFMSQTDDQGRFQLGNVPPGQYVLVVWPSEGHPEEKSVTIPAAGADYDLIIP